MSARRPSANASPDAYGDGARLAGRRGQGRPRRIEGRVGPSEVAAKLLAHLAQTAPAAGLDKVDDGAVVAAVADREVRPVAVPIPAHDELVVGLLVPQDVARHAALAPVAHVAVAFDGKLHEMDVALERLELVVVHGAPSAAGLGDGAGAHRPPGVWPASSGRDARDGPWSRLALGDWTRVGPVHPAQEHAARGAERLAMDHRLEQLELHVVQPPSAVGLGAGLPSPRLHEPMVQLGEARSECEAAVGPERLEPLAIDLEGAASTFKVVAALERTEQLALE